MEHSCQARIGKKCSHNEKDIKNNVKYNISTNRVNDNDCGNYGTLR